MQAESIQVFEEVPPVFEELSEPYVDEIVEEAGEIVSNFVPDEPDTE